MSLILTKEIKDQIRTERELAILKEDNNIISIGYGYKTTDGESTGEPAIVYNVAVKKPQSELQEGEILPSQLNVGEATVKTDVQELGVIERLSCNSGCGENKGAGSALNRTTTRPLKGGLSITSTNNSSSVGTFGMIVKDVETEALVGLTNHHVTIEDAFFTSERDLAGVKKNDYSPTSDIYQDGEGTLPSTDIIGRSLRYVPIFSQASGLRNKVDAAMFSIDSSTIDLAESWKQIGLESDILVQPPFATTVEIDALLATNPQLYSSGRTTGPKGGASCPLKLFQMGVNLSISYDLQGVSTTCIVEDVIGYFKPPLENPETQDPAEYGYCCNPVRGGDSGSALFADIGGTMKIIGLVFAGGGSGCDGGDNSYTYGYACRIDEVASALGITSWDSGDLLKTVNTSTIEYKTTSGGSSDKTSTCDSKTFWQVGLTDSLPEDNC